eukprot:NODE_636_length_5161_cov_0.504544.p5 type:complete len:174 gc:universal NODE_636_length_5161_cov_0.504544:1938-2459(+)
MLGCNKSIVQTPSHSVTIPLIDPILQYPIYVKVSLHISNWMPDSRFMVGPLRIEVVNVHYAAMSEIEQYLKSQFHFTISKTCKFDKRFQIYTSSYKYSVDLRYIPVLTSMTFRLNYCVYTDPHVLACCVKSILKNVIYQIPIDELEGIQKILGNEHDVSIEELVLSHLKNAAI